MKLVFALINMAFLAPFTIMAGPIATCAQQNPCIKFTTHKMEADQCQDGECQYKVCMTLTLDAPGCTKNPNGFVSHTCQKPHNKCCPRPGFLNQSKGHGNLPNGYHNCQLVSPGGLAEFIVKDGNAKDGCGASSKEISKTATAMCSTYGSQSCTGRGNIGKECVWSIRAPSDCVSVAATYGDPHFKRWHTYKDVQNIHFHGECDLVFLQSNHVNGGDRMDLHVRTTIEDHYSFIESAALQVGESLVQIDRKALFINRVQHQDEDLPMKLADFTILAPEMDKKSKVYTIELNDKSRVTVKKIKHFLAVAVYGHEQDFAHSEGILGDYYTGASLGRDRREIFDVTELGMEWQVREDEPNLFTDLREPQLPKEQCRMPLVQKVSRHERALKNSALFEQAKIACANKPDVESCLDDVMATGDVDLAEHQDW